MSLHHSRFGKWIPAIIFGCWGLLSASAPGQTADSQAAKDKPGIALVKPQAWSSNDQASVLEFLSFTNHSGYVEFRTAKIPNYQVASAKLVKIVVYPDSPQFLTNGEQRAALQKAIEDFAALSQAFPGAASPLNKAIAPLKADAAKYDAGNVKDNGQWMLRSAYYKQKAAALAELLRPELLSAPKIKEFDLHSNQYFLGLQDLAKAEPSVQTVVESLRALHASLVRKVDRDELLSQLSSTTMSFEVASDLVKQLKALQPREDARANLYVQSWDTAVASASKLTRQITDTQTKFESDMTGPDESGKVPAISPELSASLESLADATKAFRSGSPPPVIRVPLQLADAMLACREKFPRLAGQVQSHEFLDAKTVLDPLISQAEIIGPKTSSVVAGLQKEINGQVEKFQSLRNEAKMLAQNDKIEDALKKYQQAYAIIPTKDVAAQIESLKKQ